MEDAHDDHFEFLVSLSEFVHAEARVAMHMFAEDDNDEEDESATVRQRKNRKVEPGRGNPLLGYRST